MGATKREMCYELLVKTPGLSFAGTSTPGAAEFSRICKIVFGGPAPRPPMTKAEAEVNIYKFLTECENHFHKLTICPKHGISVQDILKDDISMPPCECPEKPVQYYQGIASSLQESWKRPIDPDHIKSIVEATLYARIEVIKKNGGIQNDIAWANNIILLNVHILLCNFAAYKNGHFYAPVKGLCWTINGALESQKEATKRKETLLKQREAKKLKSVLGAGNLPAADAAVAEERKQ
ncbi:hypothetical protein FCIRC_9556 [Fusarium circinatum]|uniref:Uncharacterized protein n=1 Tax=Fusarium circinatum TaxID=48490 RepID=A0A8H5THI0_FUSCI|nr:hypothetical protein FCIRC_9556 [Fusarium circinatum]